MRAPGDPFRSGDTDRVGDTDRIGGTDRVGDADRADDPSDGGGAQAPGAFRRTLVRVLTMQAVSLLLLWLLQSTFGG